MERKELIKKYIEFFKSKGHSEIKNSSLIPENDPTVLFTTAGMHPLVPFLLGQKHPQGKRLVNVQKCIRTGDIDEVGDDVHLTFFEMLGNWSLGDYWKKQAIEYSFEFLTKILKIHLEKFSVTCFVGDKDSSKDNEAAQEWQKLGISKKRVVFLEKKDNWWGPAGKTGPCGPDTEMFYWMGKTKPKKLTTGDNKTAEWVEIWNNVFMQYEKTRKGKFTPLKQKNVDTGMGVERTISILQNRDIFETEVFLPLIKKIEKLSGKTYKENKKEIRIIADHIKAAVFILNEEILPSNKEQGYVLRRLIRRAIRYGRKLKIKDFTTKVAEPVFEIYSDYNFDKEKILSELKKEEEKFNLTIEKGLNLFNKFTRERKLIDGKTAFLLFQSYGFPIEITKELTKEHKIKLDEEDFEKELKKHQELSKTASAGIFKSGLADNSEQTTKLHTAAHLLLESLKRVLKDDKIIQKGSNITSERLRLDFAFPRKLEESEIKKIEDLVNEQIKKEIPVIREELTLEQAKKSGAQGIFDNKYGKKVSVYTLGNFSKEICTGPHVKNTKELGKFKIIKEESSSSGIRRIKAIVEN